MGRSRCPLPFYRKSGYETATRISAQHNGIQRNWTDRSGHDHDHHSPTVARRHRHRGVWQSGAHHAVYSSAQDVHARQSPDHKKDRPLVADRPSKSGRADPTLSATHAIINLLSFPLIRGTPYSPPFAKGDPLFSPPLIKGGWGGFTADTVEKRPAPDVDAQQRQQGIARIDAVRRTQRTP